MYVYLFILCAAATTAALLLSMLMLKKGDFLGPCAFVCSFCESTNLC